MNFDMDTSDFSATFVVDTTVKEQSWMYASEEFYYPDGRLVNLSIDGIPLTSSQVEIDATCSKHYKFMIIDESLHGKTVEVNCIKKHPDTPVTLQ